MSQDHLKDIKNQKPSDDNHKPNEAIGWANFNVLKYNAYPFPGSQGSYGWHGSLALILKLILRKK